MYRDSGRGSWVAQLRVDGRLVRRRAPTQGEALARLSDLRVQRDLGVVPSGQTLEAYLRSWLRDSAAARVRQNTLRDYRDKIESYLIPAMGKVPLERLTPQHVQRMLNAMVERGLSPLTASHARSVLQNALAQAERWGLVARNVARLADPPRVPNVERETLTPAELVRLLAVIEGDRMETAFTLAAALGLRQGEVLGLRWTDVDFDARILHVRQTVKRFEGEWVFDEPKARSRRTLPLPAFVATSLERRRVLQLESRLRAGPRWNEQGLVFTSLSGGPVYGPWLTRRLRGLLKKAQLRRITFHDLRHAAGTLLQSRGVPPRVIMEVLGHSQISTTMDRYTHVPDELMRDAAEQLDAWHGHSV